MPETIDLKLTALAHGGSALGRYQGQVLFVPYSIPGETVRVEIVEAHAHWARARLVEVLEPSPHRVEPPCPHFGPGQCDGCHLQHIDYEAQVQFKHQVMVDQLERVGGLQDALVQEPIGAAEPWGYRNNTQFYLTPGGALGFLTADAHRVVPVGQCPLLEPLLEDLWAALDMEWPQLQRLTLRCGAATGDLLAIFELDHYEDFDIEVDFPVSCVLLLADGEPVVMMGHSYYSEQVDGRTVRVSAGSLFPANTGGAEALVALAREVLAPTGSETLVSAHCGVGLLPLSLAGSVKRVVGIEAEPSAAADFRHNAQGLGHVALLEGHVHTCLSQLSKPLELMVLEPPPSGVDRQTASQIVRLQPDRIAYLSGDPATLARDARLLIDSGYQLLEVQPVDLLPHTFHIHSVASFAHRSSF